MSWIPERATGRSAGLALIVVSLWTLAACSPAEEKASAANQLESSSIEQLPAERVDAERLAAEQAAAELAEREAAVAEAEAAEQQRRADLEAAERELAERQAALAEQERRAREEQARRAEEQRLAAERAAAEDRARRQAEYERELAERRAELEQQEADLREAERQAAEEREWDAPDPADEPVAPEYIEATLRPGTILRIEITRTLTSQNSVVGDRFSSRLAKDIYTDDGILAVPAGTEIRGEVIEVTPLKRIGGQASIGVAFTELVPAVGPAVGLRASFVEVGVDRRGEKKKVIAGAIAGAILGRVIGGKGAGEVLAGAAVGAAAGTAVVGAKADGKEAVIPAGETIGLVLEEVVTVTTEMTGVVGGLDR